MRHSGFKIVDYAVPDSRPRSDESLGFQKRYSHMLFRKGYHLRGDALRNSCTLLDYCLSLTTRDKDGNNIPITLSTHNPKLRESLSLRGKPADHTTILNHEKFLVENEFLVPADNADYIPKLKARKFYVDTARAKAFFATLREEGRLPYTKAWQHTTDSAETQKKAVATANKKARKSKSANRMMSELVDLCKVGKKVRICPTAYTTLGLKNAREFLALVKAIYIENSPLYRDNVELIEEHNAITADPAFHGSLRMNVHTSHNSIVTGAGYRATSLLSRMKAHTADYVEQDDRGRKFKRRGHWEGSERQIYLDTAYGKGNYKIYDRKASIHVLNACVSRGEYVSDRACDLYEKVYGKPLPKDERRNFKIDVNRICFEPTARDYASHRCRREELSGSTRDYYYDAYVRRYNELRGAYLSQIGDPVGTEIFGIEDNLMYGAMVYIRKKYGYQCGSIMDAVVVVDNGALTDEGLEKLMDEAFRYAWERTFRVYKEAA